jgi:DNA-binding transcriptional LysR family regulator
VNFLNNSREIEKTLVGQITGAVCPELLYRMRSPSGIMSLWRSWMAEFDSRAFKHFCEHVLSKLATFQTACETETRAEAGRVLGIGGQAVGKAIRSLEISLKEPLDNEFLIDHSGPLTVVPTEAGLMLLTFARQIRTLSLQFHAQLNASQHTGDIRLAMTRSAWLAYGNELRSAYNKVRPDGTVNFGNEFYSRDRVWDDIEKSVLNNEADFGIYSFPPSRMTRHSQQGAPPYGLAMHPLTEEEIVLVFPGDSSDKPRGRQVYLRKLPSPLPQVVHYRRSLGFDRTATIEAYLGQEGALKRYTGDWLLGVDSISEIKDTLVRYGGMSFLPWPDVECEHHNHSLQAYRLVPRMRPRIIWLTYRAQTSRPALTDFLKAAAMIPKKREFLP